MAEIATHAGVGVASLYRRFACKDDLVHHLCLNAMTAITATAQAALATADQDPWNAFNDFLHTALTVGAGSLTPLAGTFHAGQTLNNAAQDMYTAVGNLLARAQAAGAVRNDITARDIFQIFEMLHAIYTGDTTRREALRRRYLQLIAPALAAPAAAPLTEPPPTWQETIAAWNPAHTDHP
ncbi:TetR family transcriptional regulator [Nonomuraea fuscirosea]|uniref:TetR family transcriptional regulator n=1 Tax=Nonomuraea fuscirosea TaxID=1291556 RepID=A0A2T0LXP7_9ACTN|nr:TetR/AcrR family transcriptional regulator [Nonomuraea fuscirosea]PRX48800.1 TetR family transcriptional regulator [Nonomuraea fuscirosea]